MSDPCADVPFFEKQPSPMEKAVQATAYLEIAGMNCRNCVARVRNSLLGTHGVSAVEIDLPTGLGEVQYNPEFTSTDVLVQAVQGAGKDGYHRYDARLVNLD